MKGGSDTHNDQANSRHPLRLALSMGQTLRFGRRQLRILPHLILLLAVHAVSGCSGEQSALAPAGVEAERLTGLFWVMAAAGALIWLAVIGTAVYATRIRPGRHPQRAADRLLLWGGVAFPTVALAALLIYGLALMADLRAPVSGPGSAADGVSVAVSGEQWWWRVRYHVPGRPEPIPSANEIRLPVGERVELELSSPDVIHSFWIPSLAGKVDMIPGRVTRLVVEPTRTGTFRGACAEFCGTSHALMAFTVVVMEAAEFERWLAQQAEPAAEPEADLGRELFLQVGCGACHTVRGTPASGRIGPDLTHVASRATLGAGTLPMTRDALVRWIAHTEAIKPDVRMPSFGALPEEHVEAIAAWLEGLE